LLRKQIVKTYVVAALLLLALGASWLILNQLRVHYYNDSIEGSRGTSPYWTVVRVQDMLHWPIALLAACLFAVAIYEVARWLASKLSN
jgi:hypothetical protein